MKNHILLFCLSIFFSPSLLAQRIHFITEGEIVFEKSINMHAVLKKGLNTENSGQVAAYEQYKNIQPQFLILKSKLIFNKLSSAYLPEPSTIGTGLNYFSFNPIYVQPNKVFFNFANDSVMIQKEVLNETFLVKDKARPIKWKLTDETREIAGYSCRRANGLINDSIYVVAFYTNRIPVAVGPESFYGLPGMILGLAVPSENVTWFATQVNEKSNATNLFSRPNSGKITTQKELEEILRKTLKLMGNSTNSILIGYLL